MVFSYLEQDLEHPGYVVNCKNSILNHDPYVILDLFLCKIGRFSLHFWHLGCNSRLQIYSVFFIVLSILVNKSVMNPEGSCNGYFLPCVLLPRASNKVFSAVCLITTQCGNEKQS